MKHLGIFLAILLFNSLGYAQVTYTAQDTVQPYNGYFGYGTNSGWFPPHNNYTTSNLAAGNTSAGVPGAGCRSYRSALPDDHLTNWGTNVDFGNWQHYDNLGMKDNVAFIGYPHSSHRETAIYCPARGAQSGMFQGMYLDIWDGGLNGTPINDNNTYAVYLWQTVNMYKPYVRYWEVWNEPDFDNGSYGWRGPSDPQSWWNRDNFGCELVRFNGTIYDYIRLLRVTWEVVKYIDPDAYITTGGIGYEAFLDAILRNTDNPVDGSITPQYPKTGGAYFDVLSYHVYPQFEPEVRHYSLALGQWVNNRHSDGGADGVIGKKDRFEQVLFNRGYDGTTYPEKRWIVTEHNVGRRAYGTSIGGEDIQRNYQIKSMVLQQLNGIEQSYVYGLAEEEPLASATSTFHLMGLYSAIRNLNAYTQPLTSAGVANKTMQMLLHQTRIDPVQTASLNLPAGARGGAFRHGDGSYSYVLWAETTIDESEAASVAYSFPGALGLSSVTQYSWDYFTTGTSTSVSPSNLTLTGTPTFLKASPSLPVTLVDFAATLTEAGSVQLDWQTSEEDGNAFFTLERSADAEFFQPLGELPSQGEGAAIRSYQFFDKTPLTGLNHYRLKQTDIDGAYTYSNVVSVLVAPDNQAQLKFYPNPVAQKESLMLEFLLPEEAVIEVKVKDLHGRNVLVQRLRLGYGEYRIPLDVSELAKGYYFLEWKVGVVERVEKLVVE